MIHVILLVRSNCFSFGLHIMQFIPSTLNIIMRCLFLQIFFYIKILYKVNIFCCMPCSTESKQFHCIFWIFPKLCTKWQKITFSKRISLATNLLMLVNQEPIFGFILEIKSIPNLLHGCMVLAMCLFWGIFYKRLDKNEVY